MKNAVRYVTSYSTGDIRTWLLVVFVLVSVKVMYLVYLQYESSSRPVHITLNSVVSAQERIPEGVQPGSDSVSAEQEDEMQPVVGAGKEPLTWDSDLVNALRKREKDLRARENRLKEEEIRLQALKKEMEEKIQALADLEKRISALVDQQKASDNEKLNKLAKVFQETPPEQAGPLMSKLDVDIAAKLLLKMTGRKAGRIWGYVDPDAAVRISEVLARLNPNLDMKSLQEVAEQEE